MVLKAGRVRSLSPHYFQVLKILAFAAKQCQSVSQSEREREKAWFEQQHSKEDLLLLLLWNSDAKAEAARLLIRIFIGRNKMRGCRLNLLL